MTIKKFDGNLWKWLLDNVVSKLLPAATVSDAGKVPTVQSDGSYALEESGAFLPLAGGTMDDEAMVRFNAQDSFNRNNRLVASGDSVQIMKYDVTDPTLVRFVVEHRGDYIEARQRIGDTIEDSQWTLAQLNSTGILVKDSENHTIVINATGVHADRNLNPSFDTDFVQKKYVDDAIAAAIAQLKSDNPTLT